MQGSDGDADIENRLVDIAGEGEGVTNLESSTDIYTLPCVKQTANEKLLYNARSSVWCSVMTQKGGMGGGKETQEKVDICMYTYIYS